MFLRVLAVCLFAPLLVSASIREVPFTPGGQSVKVPPPQSRLAYSVVIENKAGGMIRVVDPPAQFLLNRPGIDLGKVVRPATRVDSKGFHAGSWGENRTVVASSVNAVHLKAYDNPDTGRAGVITLLPAELLERDLDDKPSKPVNDAIYTDIPGGHGIFGGSHPLIVGNPVNVYRQKGHLQLEPANGSMTDNDIIIIEVRTPAQWPQGLIVDNRRGGAVTMIDAAGTELELGSVDKPVTGSGRFAGGVFCESGGIRATHSGVLDLDFSPVKCTGGLQLIPEAHSHSSELTYSRESPPYGIISGVNGIDLRAQPPLFSGYLYPISNIEPPAVLPNLVVNVILDGNPEWQPLPSLIGQSDLSNLKALRVDWVLGTPVTAQAP